METAKSSAGLFASWENVVSDVWPNGPKNKEPDHKKGDIPAAAIHSKIRGLEHGVLLVEADHPGWIQILQTRQAGLLQTVQKRYPELNVRGIAFILSRGPLPAAAASAVAPTATVPAPEPLPEEQEEPVRRGSRVLPKDEELYAALKNLEESVRERNRL